MQTRTGLLVWWRRIARHPGILVGGAITLCVVLAALLAPFIAPYDYAKINVLNSWAPPGAEHLLGTDKLGRDVFSRLLVGARVSMLISVSVVAVTLVIGVGIGMIAGYLRGRIDGALMRTVDLALAFPEVVFALLVAAMLGPGLFTVVVALSFVWWPGTARLTRSLVLVLRTELFVDAAVVCGTPTLMIFWRHILPNIVAPLLVRASVGIGYVIMGEATLSFLGLGIQEPTPSWGGMIKDGLSALRQHPHLALYGSAALAITVVGFNLLGDGLRDLLDPKLRGR